MSSVFVTTAVQNEPSWEHTDTRLNKKSVKYQFPVTQSSANESTAEKDSKVFLSHNEKSKETQNI